MDVTAISEMVKLPFVTLHQLFQSGFHYFLEMKISTKDIRVISLRVINFLHNIHIGYITLYMQANSEGNIMNITSLNNFGIQLMTVFYS